MSKKLEALQQELEVLQNSIDDSTFEPRSSSGKLKTPNEIRSAIRKYLADSGSTQTKFLSEIQVNSNSFNKFMSSAYKNPWSATENSTYLSAAQFLALYKIKHQIEILQSAPTKPAKASSVLGKRPAESSGEDVAVVEDDFAAGPAVAAASSSAAPPPAKKSKAELSQMMASIAAVDIPQSCPVYANCDEVRRMIEHFLCSSGVNQTAFLSAIGAASNSLIGFRKLKGKGAGGANCVYPKAWRFFEQKRIYEGKPKSAKRLEQEKRWGPEGFPLHHDSGKRWVFSGENPNPKIYDIEYCKDMRT